MIRLKMYGLGGQGVVTAAKILVQAVAIQEGRFAKSLPAYGHVQHMDIVNRCTETW
jgi:pyruvate ferredoxin oxidoreductase gamma subunit